MPILYEAEYGSDFCSKCGPQRKETYPRYTTKRGRRGIESARDLLHKREKPRGRKRREEGKQKKARQAPRTPSTSGKSRAQANL